MFDEETKGMDVRFFSNHIDISELPSVYKNAESVKREMKEFGLGEIVDEILPFGCITAGDWQIDTPWRVEARERYKKERARGLEIRATLQFLANWIISRTESCLLWDGCWLLTVSLSAISRPFTIYGVAIPDTYLLFYYVPEKRHSINGGSCILDV